MDGAKNQADGPQAGTAIPKFSLFAAEGGQISSDALLGKPFVLYFYPKADTSGCTKEALDFSELMNEFEKLGTPVIAVSVDPLKALIKFRDKYELKVQLASAEGGEALRDFGVWVEKSMYGRRYMGIERSTYLVDRQGRVARLWRKVKVPGHAAEVLAAARAL